MPKENIFDFYGFTEQMGLIYASGGNTPKSVSSYSEIIIRDFETFCNLLKMDKKVSSKFLTPLPHSYPGISILTEDVGKIVGRGKDENNRIGTKFEVIGRAKEAETRGCGDIMSEYVS